MNTCKFLTVAMLAVTTAGHAESQEAHTGRHMQTESAPGTTGFQAKARSDIEMTDGVIRKIDLNLGKVTLRHGEIKNLQMSPMTMVFKATPDMLKGLQVGDEVRFMVDANMNVTQIEKR